MQKQLSCLNRFITPCYDIFISYRRADTKRNVAGLIYDRLAHLNLRPFLDSESMKPGDKIFDKIDSAILECKVGVAVFSPRYCDSYFCLHELALLMECNKKFIPIFYDIKPSQLRVLGKCKRASYSDLRRFEWALQEAKHTVGITFDSHNGNWMDFLTSITDIITSSLIEAERSSKKVLQLQIE